MLILKKQLDMVLALAKAVWQGGFSFAKGEAQLDHVLQRQSKAIQCAVKTYNTAESALDPPKPIINWNMVSHYKFLEEFPLL